MNEAERDDRVSRIIADCLRKADGGKPVDPNEVIAKHPEWKRRIGKPFGHSFDGFL